MYLALPLTTYPDVCAGLSGECMAIGAHACGIGSWFRVIMEKVRWALEHLPTMVQGSKSSITV